MMSKPMSTLEQSSTFTASALSRRLVEIGLDPKTKAYAATPAIMSCMSILQTGVMDR